MTLSMVLLVALVSATAALPWFALCNNKCLKQRTWLIRAVAAANVASGFKKSYWFVFDSISYEAHMWRLFTFRDPWAIYPAAIKELGVGA